MKRVTPHTVPNWLSALDTLWQTPPLPFRQQNGGDYNIPALTLREDILPGEQGLAIHQRIKA